MVEAKKKPAPPWVDRPMAKVAINVLLDMLEKAPKDTHIEMNLERGGKHYHIRVEEVKKK